MYTSLKIVKKLPFAWIYYPNGLSTGFTISKGYFSADEETRLFQIVEQGKTKRPEVLLENITLVDETGDNLEVYFNTFAELQQKLSELGNPLMNMVSPDSAFTTNQMQAIQNSNNPSSINHFATMQDIGAFASDGIVTSTGYVINDQEITFSPGWVWRINGVEYTNPISLTRTIPYAAEGLSRFDKFVLNTSNDVNRIAGDESSSNIVEPETLPDTIQACIVLVNDSTINESTPPITGDKYVEKVESQDFTANYGTTTVIEQIDLTDNRSSISVIGSATDVKSVQLSSEFIRPGKPHFLKNRTDHDITLWHLAGTGNIKYFLPDGLNFVVKPNQIIEFNLNANDSSNIRFELVGTQLGYTPENLANKGVANGYASLGADGKVPNSQIPALAISETFPVSSQAEMLALSQAEQGDVAIRSDISKSFILRQSPPSILANWSELLTPTDAVTSVNGKVGVVNLTTDDIPDSTNKRYQTDAQQTNNDATSSIQNQLNSKISGSGTSNYIPKTTSSNILGDSQIYDNGSDVGLFTNTPSAYQHSGSNKAVEIYNPSTSVDAQSHVILSNASIQPLSSIGSLTWALRNSTNSVKMAGVFGAVTDASFTSLSPRTNVFLNVHNGSVSAEAFRVLYNGNFGIGTPSPIAKLDVNGTSNFRDMITLNAQDKAFIIGTSGAANFAQIYYGSSSKSLIFTDSAGGNTFIIRDSDKRVSIPNLSGTGTRTVVADTSGNLSATNTINSQINTGTPTAPTAAAGTNTTQIATTAFVMANARPYKTYVAKISQTGTSNPTSIVLENTTGLTFTLTRTLTGFYEISPGVSMGSNLHIAINKEHADALVTLQHYSDSIIRIITTDLSGNPVDTKLANNSFELRIYP